LRGGHGYSRRGGANNNPFSDEAISRGKKIVVGYNSGRNKPRTVSKCRERIEAGGLVGEGDKSKQHNGIGKDMVCGSAAKREHNSRKRNLTNRQTALKKERAPEGSKTLVRANAKIFARSSGKRTGGRGVKTQNPREIRKPRQ